MYKPINRISLILLGAAIYWVGYCGFFMYMQNMFISPLCVFLGLTGLFMAGWNSNYLYKGR
jgi:hypothetical protein